MLVVGTKGEVFFDGLRQVGKVERVISQRRSDELISAQNVDAAFEGAQFALRERSRVVTDEHLIAAVEGGFDDVGVLDIDAEDICDDAADEGEFALALTE